MLYTTIPRTSLVVPEHQDTDKIKAVNPSALLSIIWLIFWIYWFVAAFGSKRNATFNTRGAGGRLIIFFLVIIVLRFTTHGLEPNSAITNPVLIAIGFFLVAIGLGLCIWARLSMGRNWGMPMTQKVETEVVTTGPYHYIRHPIYTGILTALIGTCFIVGFYWLIIFAVAGVYFIYSAVIEERNLSKTLPKVYPAYKRQTKMFIPFVV